jgi:hypothetical protein
MTALWDVAPCSLVEVYGRFRGAYCLHYEGDDRMMMEAVNTSETSVNFDETTRGIIPEGCHLPTGAVII